MTKEDRAVMIDMLVVMTGKGDDYFNRMDNKRLEQEYDREYDRRMMELQK